MADVVIRGSRGASWMTSAIGRLYVIVAPFLGRGPRLITWLAHRAAFGKGHAAPGPFSTHSEFRSTPIARLQGIQVSKKEEIAPAATLSLFSGQITVSESYLLNLASPSVPTTPQTPALPL